MNRYASPALIATVSLFTHSVNAFDVEPYPGFRFRDYTKLTSDEKLAAAELGYTAASWNQLGDAYAENLSWWYNTNMDYYDQDGDGDYYEPNPKFLSAATKLGFTEDVWDCWINHYGYYSWEELVEYNIAPSYEELGWTEDKWNEIDTEKPDTESKSFAELSTKQKTAAITVCYTQTIWDGEEFPFCVDSPRSILLKNGKELSCNWASKNLARCDQKEGEFSKHCPNTCGTCATNECAETKLKVLWHVRKSDGQKKFKKCHFALNTAKQKKLNCKKKFVRETCPSSCALEKCQSSSTASAA